MALKISPGRWGQTTLLICEREGDAHYVEGMPGKVQFTNVRVKPLSFESFMMMSGLQHLLSTSARGHSGHGVHSVPKQNRAKVSRHSEGLGLLLQTADFFHIRNLKVERLKLMCIHLCTCTLHT